MTPINRRKRQNSFIIVFSHAKISCHHLIYTVSSFSLVYDGNRDSTILWLWYPMSASWYSRLGLSKTSYRTVRGAIKKFSARPCSVLNKIKIVFASYRSKAQNTTCTMDFLATNILYILAVIGCLHSTWKKGGVTQYNEMTILTDSFVPLHALLFWVWLIWLRIDVVEPRFLLSKELWNKFLRGHVSIVREVLQKPVRSSGVSILQSTPIWQTLCSYAEMNKICKIFIAQKSHCTCRVLSLATIRCKYYFLILFWTELGQAENFLVAPHIRSKLRSV